MAEKTRVAEESPGVKRAKSSSHSRKTDFSRSARSPIDHILTLHQTIGNQAVQRLFKTGMLQTELNVNQAHVSISGAVGDLIQTQSKDSRSCEASWEADPQSFSKVVADYYVRMELGVSPPPMAKNIWCSGDKVTCEITYSDDLVVMVSFVNVPDHVIVRKSGTRFGPRCEYDYHCMSSGSLVLTKRKCEFI